METVVRLAGLCLAAAVFASLLKKDSPELGLLLALGAALAGGSLLLNAAGDAAALAGELVELTGLSPVLFAPLGKVIAVSLVARLVSALCADAGQGALARLMETAGAFCALGCAVPLLRAAVELLRGWL